MTNGVYRATMWFLLDQHEFIGPSIFKEYATPFKFKKYVPFERKPDDPMQEHIKRLIEKLIPWPNTFSEQDGFAIEPLTLTGGRHITGEDRSSYNRLHAMTPVFWEPHYKGEDMLHGHPKMQSKQFTGPWFGSRKAADNHSLFINNGANCRVSCLP